MAKIGLFTFAGLGHVNPMAALGRRLQRTGHTVVFFQVPDMEKAVKEAGLDFIPVGAAEFPPGALKRLDTEVAKLSGLNALKFLISRQVASCHMLLATLPELLRDAGFNLLLIDTAELAPSTVAEHLGIPIMMVDLLPPAFDEASAPPWCFGWSHGDGALMRLRNFIGNRFLFWVIRPIIKTLAAQRRRWGLPAAKSPEDYISCRTRISQMPQLLDFPRRRLPSNFHYTGPFTDAEARAPVDFPWQCLNGKPLIYASMGTLQNGIASVFQAVAEAVQDLDVQLVISTGGGLAPADLGSLAGKPIVVRYAPQIALIKQAALVITHAGINTSLEALQCGKAMVALPVSSDQPGIAARLKRIGVAEVVPAARISAERIKQAVQQVLEGAAYAERAAQVQQHLLELCGLDRAATLVNDELQYLASTRLQNCRAVF